MKAVQPTSAVLHPRNPFVRPFMVTPLKTLGDNRESNSYTFDTR